MANSVDQLKVAVAGFMQRDPEVFKRTVGPEPVDLLLRAVNNARLYAERRVDFEYSKCDVDVPGVSRSLGAQLTSAVLHGTSTPVSVKKIITPYLSMSDGNNYPIDLISRKAWDDRVKRLYEKVQPTDKADTISFAWVQLSLVQDGQLIYVVPPDDEQLEETFTVYLNVIKWLPAYSEGTESDFLLDSCFDWMMFYCISQLNYFLKEDERVKLSADILRDTWDALVKWNSELHMSTTESYNLD